MQPLPLTQRQRSQPGVEHHKEDASQGEGDGEEGGFGFAEAVVEGGIYVGHYFNNSIIK